MIGKKTEIAKKAVLVIIATVVIVALIAGIIKQNNHKNKIVAEPKKTEQKFVEEEKVGVEYKSTEVSEDKIGVTNETLYTFVSAIIGNKDNVVKMWEYEKEKDGKVQYDKIPDGVKYVLCYGNEDKDISKKQFDGIKIVLLNVSNQDLEALRYDVSIKTGAIKLKKDEKYDGLKYKEYDKEVSSIDKMEEITKYVTLKNIFDILAIIDGNNRKTYENNYVHYVNSLGE